ncbi:MAG: hypothetical protein V4858_18260 [Pseudomonadota bacterium]
MLDSKVINTAAQVAAAELAREVAIWRRLSQDGVRIIMAQQSQENGIAINANAVLAQDILYISVERELVNKLRSQSVDSLERFQHINRDLVPRLLAGNDSDEKLVSDLHSYHHFFDAIAGFEQMAVHRAQALAGHSTHGDRINATFDTNVTAQVRRFRRLILTRKRLFLDDLLVAWMAGFQSEKSHANTQRFWVLNPMTGGIGGLGESVLQVPPTWFSRIRSFVTEHMDYDLDWMRKTLARAHESAPPLLQAPDATESTLSRYREAVKNMKSVDEDLEALLKKVGKFERMTTDQLDKFNELHAERLVNQQIAEVSAKQMPLLSSIGKNITDFKVGDAALQAMLLIGQSSALAALDGIKKGLTGYGHRVDWTEVGNEALIDLAQIGGMAAVTLLFGPGAGAGAASLIGLIFRGKAPDPHEQRYKALDKKLDRVLDRISALEDAVMARLNAIPGQVRNVVVEERFRASVSALSDQFSNIQRRYEELLTGRRHHLYGVDLHAEVQGMRDNLQSLVRSLWCDGFALNPRLIAEQVQIRGEQDGSIASVPRRIGEDLPNRVLLGPTASSVIVTLIKGANHEGHAQRFEHTIDAIHSLAQLVAELGSAYSRAIEHVLATLGASLVLPGSGSPVAALVQARDLDQLVSEDLQVLLWVGAELRRAPGKRNLELYERLAPCRKSWKNLDPFRGFILFDQDKSENWLFEVQPGGDEDVSHKVQWIKKGSVGLNDQLFIVPDGDSIDKPYTFVTALSGRQAATARLALGLDDTLSLHIGKQVARVRCNFIGDNLSDSRTINWAVNHKYNEPIGNESNTIGTHPTVTFALAASGSHLALALDKVTRRLAVSVQIDVAMNGKTPPLRTIPLINVSLDDSRFTEAYKSNKLRWVIGRENTNQDQYGAVFVGVGVMEPADKNHPLAWTRMLEVFSLNPAQAVNNVQSESAYDIPVSFKNGDRTVSVLFDNLRAFIPKNYLIRGQSLPAGGYLMSESNYLTIVPQIDRNLVIYYENGIDKESVKWASNSWDSNGTNGGPLALSSEGTLEQKSKDGKHTWSAAQYDTKRGSSWKRYQNGEAFRLIIGSDNCRLLDAQGRNCFVFDNDQIRKV